MATLFDIELSEDEGRLITSVIVDLVCDNEKEKISNEDILHRLLQMAESHYKLENANRIIRKGIANVKQGKHHCKENEFAEGSYAKGFLDCAELIQNIIS